MTYTPHTTPTRITQRFQRCETARVLHHPVTCVASSVVGVWSLVGRRAPCVDVDRKACAERTTPVASAASAAAAADVYKNLHTTALTF